jgi:Spy/CpxP family protein refolding chaperone
MKKIILTTAVVFVCILAVNAQGRFSMKDRLKMMKDSLALSDSQTVIIDSILTASSDKMKNVDSNEQDRRTIMMQITTDTNKEIEKVLTDDQKTKFEQMLAQRRNRMRNRDNNGN